MCLCKNSHSHSVSKDENDTRKHTPLKWPLTQAYTHARTHSKPKVKNNTIESEPFQYTTATIHTIFLLFLLPCFLCCSLRCSERSYSFYFSLTPRSAVSYAIVFLSLFVCLSFASVHTVLPLLFFMRSARVLVFKFLLSFLPYPCRETQFNAKSEMCVAYTESTCSSLCRQL